MNTKFFISFVLLLFLFPQTISFSKQQTQSEHPTHISYANPDNNEKPADKPWDCNLALPNNCDINNSHHNSEDDGKCHHFHFERYARRKNKMLFCFLGKLILLFAHLSCLVIGYLHYLQ